MTRREVRAPAGRAFAGCYIGNMRHLYFSIAAGSLALLCFACSAATQAPVQAPSRVDDAVTRAPAPSARRPARPPLVAPPPAYGNKIVMAQRNATVALE
jgi:hypothetical protein